MYAHVIFFIEVIISTVTSSNMQYQHDKVFLSTFETNTLISSRLGFFILTLVSAQGLFGLLTLFFRIKTKNFQALAFLTRAHKVAGWTLMFCSLFSIYSGKKYLGSEAGVYVLMACLMVFCELLFNFVSVLNNHTYVTRRLKEMTHENAFMEIKNGKEYMFADNFVIDVRSFKFSHPGGSYFISHAIGEDTGKYMTGCSSYGGKFQPYTHSENAFSLLRYLAVAKIPYPIGYILRKNSESQDCMEFQIYTQQPLNEQIWLLTLKSDFFYMNDNCEIS